MEKQIIRDKVLSIDLVSLSEKRPIKFIYKGISNPIFTIRVGDFSFSANKPHTMLSLKQLDNTTKVFLDGLDEMIPRIAYERRKDWFTSDLHESNRESFIENYRRNISDYGFSIYLGLVNGNQLPVSTFLKDHEPDKELPIFPIGDQVEGRNEEPRPLIDSFQELAWGTRNGQITILAGITGLWIKEESYGLSWKVYQILYKRRPTLPRGSQILTVDKIRGHTWICPPDEADPVELQDEEESAGIIVNDESKISGVPEILSSDITDISPAPTSVKTSATTVPEPDAKPYNPLMDTDD